MGVAPACRVGTSCWHAIVGAIEGGIVDAYHDLLDAAAIIWVPKLIV